MNIHPSSFRVSLPFVTIPTGRAEEITTAALSLVRESKTLYRRPAKIARILDAQHTTDYVTDMLAERRPLPFSAFIRLLFALDGETVRRVLDTIASAFGFTVVPIAAPPAKDIRTEIIESSAASGRLYDRVYSAILDNEITEAEAAEVVGAVREMQRQAEDIAVVIGPWVTK
jgi:hypothetical protein